MKDKYKLHPRNAPALELAKVAGNPVTTTLESGVGNCFPGLECDIRNLERRFFPHLSFDFITLSAAGQSFSSAVVSDVDIVAVRSAGLPPEVLDVYETIFADLSDPSGDGFWFLSVIRGNFGPFGERTLRILDIANNNFVTDLGTEETPDDAWTAVRLLAEGEDVSLTLRDGELQPLELTLPRIAYLDEFGALNESFQAGELTQSLCSPWTHDFRDCGCFYWASNHPDISLQQRGMGAPDPDLDRPVFWQRGDRGSPQAPAPPADANGPARGTPFRAREEMDHYEINVRWPELGLVLDGREQGDSYIPSQFDAEPFATVEELEQNVRYAAGVELAVTLEYLAAAYSLDRQATGGTLADDVRASFAEMMRIAIGEMKHMRAVNDLLRALSEPRPSGQILVPDFSPALQVAAELPAGGGTTRPLAFRPLTQATLASFIDIERPSFSVDGLYGRILATVRNLAPGPLEALVQSIMADGTDHFETFSFIQEWLGRHSEDDYLIDNLRLPQASDSEHTTLQTNYRQLLETLHNGYTAGLPTGAITIAAAREAMLSDDGIRGNCEALAAAGIQVAFEAPADPRFTPINRP